MHPNSKFSEKNFLGCIPPDTVTNNFKIKYVIEGSSFAVRVFLKEYDTLLPYRFDCSIPPALIPMIFKSSRDVVCLRRGYGQNFSQLIICSIENSRLKVKEYEIGLTVDLENNNVIYQNYDTLEQIHIENIFTGEKQNYFLPDKSWPLLVWQADIRDNKLWLEFSYEKKLSIPYINGVLGKPTRRTNVLQLAQ